MHERVKLINIKYLWYISFKITIGDKCYKLICLYRSPSQTNNEFESFLRNFELILDKIHEENPFKISVLGDFKAKSNNWCKNDTASLEGSIIDAVTSNYGLHQLIQEPTHTINSSSSCINLIFASQPNLVIKSGAHSSLHPNCHHYVVFTKFNLSILYPPPYERSVWFYERAKAEFIWRAINKIRSLSNLSVDEKVRYFTKTLLNIIHNFISYERIVDDDSDPFWINNEIKKLMNNKHSAYKSSCSFNRDVFLFEKFKVLQNQLNMSMENSQQMLYSNLSSKLATPATSSKTYWSILKIFLNDKKIPCISPLFHKNKFLTNFKEKAELFNTFFCKPIHSIERQYCLA